MGNARLVSPNQTMERGGGITDGLYNPMEHVSMSTMGDSGIPGVGNLGGDNIVGGGDNMANPGVSGNRNNLGPALTGLGNVSQGLLTRAQNALDNSKYDRAKDSI